MATLADITKRARLAGNEDDPNLEAMLHALADVARDAQIALESDEPQISGLRESLANLKKLPA